MRWGGWESLFIFQHSFHWGWREDADSCVFETPANSEVEVGEPWESDPAPNPEEREEGRKRRNVLGPYLPDKGNYSKCFGITALPSSCHAMKGLTVWPSEQSSCVSRYLFHCTWFFEDLMVLFWGCADAMCCCMILLQSGVWKAFAEGTLSEF